MILFGTTVFVYACFKSFQTNKIALFWGVTFPFFTRRHEPPSFYPKMFYKLC